MLTKNARSGCEIARSGCERQRVDFLTIRKLDHHSLALAATNAGPAARSPLEVMLPYQADRFAAGVVFQLNAGTLPNS